MTISPTNRTELAVSRDRENSGFEIESGVQAEADSRVIVLKALLLVLLIAGIAVAWFSPLRSYLTIEGARTVVARLRELWYGPLVYGAAFTVGAVLVVPASVFVLSAGMIWGWKLGGIYALAGGASGAIASFLIGRFMGSGFLRRFGPIGERLTRQIDHAGFRPLLVMRLMPIFPFALINYGAGVAGVRLRDFAAATLIGMAPSVFVFAYSADALFNGTMTGQDAFKRILTVGFLLSALVLTPSLIKKMRRSNQTVE